MSQTYYEIKDLHPRTINVLFKALHMAVNSPAIERALIKEELFEMRKLIIEIQEIIKEGDKS